MHAPNPSNLTISRLHKSFGKSEVLCGINQTFASGVTAILGPNGAGKTTLIRCAIGLEKADAGTIELCGGDPTNPKSRQMLGVMLQDGDLPELLTPRELLTLFASYYPQPSVVTATLELANVSSFADKRYGKLSGGQKRRVQFALAIIGNPTVLFLDEPTTGLDLDARLALWQVVREFSREGRTIILTTHYHEEAEQLADQIVRMKNGRIDEAAATETVASAPALMLIRCKTDVPVDQLRDLPAALLALRDGDYVQLRSENSAETLRALFAIDISVSDLSVVPHSLDITLNAEQKS